MLVYLKTLGYRDILLSMRIEEDNLYGRYIAGGSPGTRHYEPVSEGPRSEVEISPDGALQ
jgi:hypothetical protein